MDEFVKKYKEDLFKRHILIAIVTMFLIVFFYVIYNSSMNGLIINVIERIFGSRIASELLGYEEAVLIFGTLSILIVEWIIVEASAVEKLANIIEKLQVIFQKNEQLVHLDKEFKEIETSLNVLKLETMKNEQLAQIEVQRKNDLIAYLAHDIKTPLASVIGYLSLLEEASDMPSEQKEKYTKIALIKAYRLEQLINEFFDITRFNLSSIPLEKEYINIKFMLQQMVEEFYPMLEPSGRGIEILLEEEIQCYADPDKLARVLNNIIKNAIFYSYPKSIITIEAKETETSLEIQIRNHGKTISSHKQKMIFEKFYRLDSARSTNTGGSGLGLAIAKEIMVQHGGDIKVTSKNDITEFTIVIPKMD